MNPDKHDDITDAFGSAFHAEPPLGIDRVEVVRKGRNRLRQRRLAAAGGAAVGVAVVMLSVTMVTGFGSGSRVMPAGPGQSTSVTDCPLCATPRLPVSPTATRSENSSPPMSTQATGTGAPSGRDAQATAERAEELTAVLASGNIVPPGCHARPVPYPGNPGPLVFVPGGKVYEASADLVDAEGGEGSLHIVVGSKAASSPRPDCAPPASCEIRTVSGQQVQLTTVPFGPKGEILLMAYTQGVDGSHVYAMVSNVSAEAVEDNGKANSAPTIEALPLNGDQLVKIVTLQGLSF